MKPAVLITGGSRGIGREMVKTFSEKGYQVYFTYCHSEKEALELTRDFGVKGFQVDFSDTRQIISFATSFLKEYGCPDVLINNAGLSHYGLIQDTTLEDYQRIFAVNFESMFFLTKELVSPMISRQKGAIINISSIWGQCGASCEVLYSASKAAVIGFTKALAKEVALSGISVNCIAPGAVDTDMLSCFTLEEKEEIAAEIPSGRFTTAKEVAELALFLAQMQTPAFTGQVIPINGGLLC